MTVVRDSTMARVGLLLHVCLALIGCKAGVSSANVPPTGEVWFGASFDTTTFAITGRTSSVKVGAPFAAVANIGKTVDGSAMNMRIYLDGTLLTTTGLSWTGSGDVWGWSPNPAYAAGSWRYELTDVGGNVLATGQIEATD